MSEGPGQVVELPDGVRLRAPSAVEARILYREIAVERTYGKHGVRVRPGDCVFDVGANAGFFSVLLAREHPAVSLYAFEPIPPLFAILERNVREQLGAATRVRLFPFGLGAAPARLAFRYNPDLTMTASAHGAALERSTKRDAGALAWARAAIDDAGRSGELAPATVRRLRWSLATPGVNVLALAGLGVAAAALAAKRRLRETTIDAEVRTLSRVVRDEAVARIDLLKVDVEGAEWDVLAGIEPAHWPLIQQLVVEVHDADGRVARVAELLRARGFEVVVDREDWALHELLGIFTVYARRPERDP